jgi:hypothetical protein
MIFYILPIFLYLIILLAVLAPLKFYKRSDQFLRGVLVSWTLLRIFNYGTFLIPGTLFYFLSVTDPNVGFALQILTISTVIIIESLSFYYIIDRGMRFSPPIQSYDYQLRRPAIIVLCAISFIVLAYYLYKTNFFSHFDPRIGYQNYRKGNGHLWAFSIFFITLSFVIITSTYNRVRPLTLVTITYLGLIYLCGSKGVLLNIIFFVLFIYIWKFNLAEKNARRVLYFCSASILLLVFSNFFGIGSGYAPKLSSVLRYFDQFVVGNRLYEDSLTTDFSFRWGEVWLTSLWEFFPRAIFADKPFAYGTTLVLEHYYPGMAERGGTPSFGLFSNFYFDFGPFAFIRLFLSAEYIATCVALLLLFNQFIQNDKRVKLPSALVLVVPSLQFHVPVILSIFLIFLIVEYCTERRVKYSSY